MSNYGKSRVKGQTMTLGSSTHKSSCTHLDNSNYHFLGQNLHNFHEMDYNRIFSYLILL